MSSESRVPVMKLPVNQEVFLDSVKDGDAVNDATVATEVVSFEKVGDAYVLEGAVVFAGYLTRVTDRRGNQAFTVDVEDEQGVQHIHHRMPFTLRVPMDSQADGMLSVKSRISGWKLTTLSENWIRVAGELQISGLTDEGGYHFQCGSTEAGDALFGRNLRNNSDVGAPSNQAVIEIPETSERSLEFAGETGWRSVPAEQETIDQESSEEELAEVRFAERSEHVQVTSNHPKESLEQVSSGRVGHTWADNESTTESHPHGFAVSLEASQTETKQEIAPAVPPTVANEEYVVEVETDDVTTVEQQPVISFREQAPIAEYEFEHQMSSEELESVERTTKADTFVPSQSFTKDGFRATSGFVPPVYTVQSLGEYESSAVARGEHAPYTAQPIEPVTEEPAQPVVQKDLWSFVDFNAPDSKCAVRFVIVMEEETIQTVADRCGCLKSELIRVNKLTVEIVEPGMALMVPQAPFTLVFPGKP